MLSHLTFNSKRDKNPCRNPVQGAEEPTKSPSATTMPFPGFFLDRNFNNAAVVEPSPATGSTGGLPAPPLDSPLLSLPHLASALMVFNMQRGRLPWGPPPQPGPLSSDSPDLRIHTWLSEAAAGVTKRTDLIDQQPLNLSYKSDHPIFRDSLRKCHRIPIVTHQLDYAFISVKIS